MRNNTLNQSAAEQAERLYNRVCDYTVDLPYTKRSDQLIARTKHLYESVIKELYAAGIGGVLINGTFRCTAPIGISEVNHE